MFEDSQRARGDDNVGTGLGNCHPRSNDRSGIKPGAPSSDAVVAPNSTGCFQATSPAICPVFEADLLSSMDAAILTRGGSEITVIATMRIFVHQRCVTIQGAEKCQTPSKPRFFWVF